MGWQRGVERGFARAVPCGFVSFISLVFRGPVLRPQSPLFVFVVHKCLALRQRRDVVRRSHPRFCSFLLSG